MIMRTAYNLYRLYRIIYLGRCFQRIGKQYILSPKLYRKRFRIQQVGCKYIFFKWAKITLLKGSEKDALI